jgi:hypothetical protein
MDRGVEKMRGDDQERGQEESSLLSAAALNRVVYPNALLQTWKVGEVPLNFLTNALESVSVYSVAAIKKAGHRARPSDRSARCRAGGGGSDGAYGAAAAAVSTFTSACSTSTGYW